MRVLTSKELEKKAQGQMIFNAYHEGKERLAGRHAVPGNQVGEIRKLLPTKKKGS